MKYILIILFPFCLIGQNGQPEQLQFNITGLPQYFNSDEAFFDKTDRIYYRLALGMGQEILRSIKYNLIEIKALFFSILIKIYCDLFKSSVSV